MRLTLTHYILPAPRIRASCAGEDVASLLCPSTVALDRIASSGARVLPACYLPALHTGTGHPPGSRTHDFGLDRTHGNRQLRTFCGAADIAR